MTSVGIQGSLLSDDVGGVAFFALGVLGSDDCLGISGPWVSTDADRPDGVGLTGLAAFGLSLPGPSIPVP